jgi:hypothetical protein
LDFLSRFDAFLDDEVEENVHGIAVRPVKDTVAILRTVKEVVSVVKRWLSCSALLPLLSNDIKRSVFSASAARYLECQGY